jgi:hypothetical protein
MSTPATWRAEFQNANRVKNDGKSRKEKKPMYVWAGLNAQIYAKMQKQGKNKKGNHARNTARLEYYLLCAGIHVMVFLVVHERVGEYKQAVARKIRRSTYRL